MLRWRNAVVAAALAVGIIVALPPPPADAETIRQMQWFLGAVGAIQAQKVTKGDGVIVGLVDSGVDAGHRNLAGAVLPGTSFPGSDSAQGHTDPVGHGTKMAGIIAARGGGDNDALGIAPRARILPVAVPKDFGSLAEPIRWAVDHGAKVINLSLGHTGASPPDEAAAIAYAAAKDVVVVSAAGNQEQGNVEVGSPANLPGVVAVAGTERSGEFWTGSAHGPEVAISAPAEDIVSAGARNVNTTGFAGGGATSEACAIVSGVVALIRAKFPKLDAANVINRLLQTATDKGDHGRDPFYGFGLVNAQRAVSANVPAVQANPLGAPAAATATAAGDQPGAAGDGGPLGSPMARLGLVVGIAVFVVLVLVLLIMLLTRGSRRRPAPVAGPAPLGYPPPGYPAPPGRPASGGYPTPPQYPAPPGRPAAPGYPAQPGGYPVPPGYPPTPGRGPQPGYPAPMGHPPQPGNQQSGGHRPQPTAPQPPPDQR